MSKRNTFFTALLYLITFVTYRLTGRWYSALSQIRTRACASDSAFRANVASFLMARLV